MIDHVTLLVSDLARSKAFYTAALAPLGYTVLRDFGKAVGFGVAPKPDFWLGEGVAHSETHLAFRARSREEVRAFHAAALAAGGEDNGAPGVRAHYHPNYFGAFVRDPDGYNIEAVFHDPA